MDSCWPPGSSPAHASFLDELKKVYETGSRDFRWGNRLFNLGTYLAPGYDAHIGFVGLRYRF